MNACANTWDKRPASASRLACAVRLGGSTGDRSRCVRRCIGHQSAEKGRSFLSFARCGCGSFFAVLWKFSALSRSHCPIPYGFGLCRAMSKLRSQLCSASMPPLLNTAIRYREIKCQVIRVVWFNINKANNQKWAFWWIIILVFTYIMIWGVDWCLNELKCFNHLKIEWAFPRLIPAAALLILIISSLWDLWQRQINPDACEPKMQPATFKPQVRPVAHRQHDSIEKSEEI